MKPGFQNDNVIFKLPKLERNCQKSKERRFDKNYHQDVLTWRSWRNCNKQAKGLMAQSSVTLYAENWLRDYENMQSESVMAVSELFDLKNKRPGRN
jgi:hypothetical protein